MDKPKFFMLIGLPRCGKSKFGKEFAEQIGAEYMSLERQYNDPIAQEKSYVELLRRAKKCLREGISVVYEAPNTTLRKSRKHVLSQLPQCKKIAQVVFARYQTCVERDKKREDGVGERVIKSAILEFQAPYYDEGWNEIYIHMNDSPYTIKDYNDQLMCEHDNPHHNNTVNVHTLQVVEEAAKYIPSKEDFTIENGVLGILLSMAAALHDVGKKFTKQFKDSRGNKTEVAHYYGHHNVSAYFSLGYEGLEKVGLDMREKMLVVWLVNNHMEPFFNSKYYKGLNDGHRELLDALHSCDVKGA